MMDPTLSERHNKIGMMMVRHCDRPCYYRDGGGEWLVFTLPEDGHVGFPMATSADTSVREFYPLDDPSNTIRPCPLVQ